MLASIDSFGYRFLLLGHFLTIFMAFAPAFVWPVLNRRRRVEGGELVKDVKDLTGSPMSATASAEGALTGVSSPLFHGASLVLAGLFGILMIVISDSVFEFSQTWVSIAFVLWFIMLGVFFAGIIPAQRALRGGKVSAEQRIAMFYGSMHLLLLLQIIDMIWKPGLGG